MVGPADTGIYVLMFSINSQAETLTSKQYGFNKFSNCYQLYCRDCAVQMVMTKCQTVLENADTPDILFAVVDVISFIVKTHPHCFRPHFRVCARALMLSYYNYYYNTRRKCDLHLASMYSAVGKKSITNKGCNLWNKLPENIKTVGSYYLFRETPHGFY